MNSFFLSWVSNFAKIVSYADRYGSYMQVVNLEMLSIGTYTASQLLRMLIFGMKIPFKTDRS